MLSYKFWFKFFPSNHILKGYGQSWRKCNMAKVSHYSPSPNISVVCANKHVSTQGFNRKYRNLMILISVAFIIETWQKNLGAICRRMRNIRKNKMAATSET